MISISISREAYEAIRATLPEAAESFPAQTDERGLIRIWLDRPFVDRLGQMRGPGESYSDVIMRVAKGWRPSGRLGGRFV
jgi:predicted CopG family antitoxin